MEFHQWYQRSIEEAQERNKKEDKNEEHTNIDYNNELYDMNYGSIDIDDEDVNNVEWTTI